MDVTKELNEAIEKVLLSKSKKKLIIAGPGAGKTTLFRKLLEGTEGAQGDRVVLTFINNLKIDLERGLGDLAQIYTLHGYCQSLLHRYPQLRDRLTENFVCFPGLASLIKRDWLWITDSEAPAFVEQMRRLACPDEQVAFYFELAKYYDAVDFDDSVFRIHRALIVRKDLVPEYKLVLIDEFQDFNKMEAAVIDLLGEKNPITIAGDDDQALYSQLRDASWDYIRQLHGRGDYEVFHLPFCMRCPEVIVSAVADILAAARRLKKLAGRINKPFRFFEPRKGGDSKRFPRIEYVTTTVQRENANYFGKYIEKIIRSIPARELDEAAKSYEAAALIIGSNPYRRQVHDYLIERGVIKKDEEEEMTDREKALQILAVNSRSNLGWRIILSDEAEDTSKRILLEAMANASSLVDVMPDELRISVLEEVAAFVKAKTEEQDDDRKEKDSAPAAVKLTSYEGAKGLSAQYVFLIGVHEGEIPRNAGDPTDIEICRFLVGLTRTKKKCMTLVTRHFADSHKRPSIFLGWIDPKRFEPIYVNAAYWARK